MPGDYDLAFFHDHDFTRRTCPTCGRAFWTQGDHANCGETPCQEYLFIGSPGTVPPLTLGQMRETFQTFFERRDHTRVGRYPIVARWREDVFYVQASVYPFQPWVISGVADPPANPLVLSQPCVRFDDVDNVGKTGQHFTLFEMMAHHAFNFPKKPIYWQERTTALCHEFLTTELGLPGERIRYVESWWEGGGNSGPCFEVTADGAELATLVFMAYQGEGKSRTPMDTRVVDTGYGLERLTWFSQGSPSAYEAVFGEVLERLKKVAGVATDPELLAEYSRVAGGMKIETHGDMRALREQVARRVGLSVEALQEKMLPLEDLYAICDHARALPFLLADGVVPSNVKEGYFARLIQRRALRALDRQGLRLDLPEIVTMQIEHFAADFPELAASREAILSLLEVEEAKYRETLRKGKRLVSRFTDGLSDADLVELYDSHGLVPEVVQEFAAEAGLETPPVPDDFFSRVAERHLQPEEGMPTAPAAPAGFPPTELLFYEDPRKLTFTARVLGTRKGQVILDRTGFYPEGGGQEADHGVLGTFPVTDVQLAGGVVLHRVKGKGLRKGQRVEGQVDEKRRLRLMRHHTATHIVNGAARAVLGRHVWQTGAHKSEAKATLDLTHYQGLSEEELEAIETLANRIVWEDRPVHQGFERREVAEAEHGFVLYQGGSIPGKELRIVDIENFDVEACGGTHLFRTGEVGLIKILRSRRIQDGVVRLEYVAGEAALEHVRDRERTVQETSAILQAPPEELPEAARRLRGEWSEARKALSRIEGRQVTDIAEELLAQAEEVRGYRLVVHEQSGAGRDLLALARALLTQAKVVCVLGARNDSAALLVGRTPDVPLQADRIVQRTTPLLGGKGGGREDFAQGGGPEVARLEQAMALAVAQVREALQASGGANP